jgi:hypothetical protein
VSIYKFRGAGDAERRAIETRKTGDAMQLGRIVLVWNAGRQNLIDHSRRLELWEALNRVIPSVE